LNPSALNDPKEIVSQLDRYVYDPQYKVL